jgi:hypothetical protein
MGRLNKPNISTSKYKSRGLTSAHDMTPNLKEDVRRAQDADIEKIEKGLKSPAKSAVNRKTQQEAGGRALSRSLGRAGLLSAAGQAGLHLGDALDRNFPAVGRAVDKAIEKSGVGKAIDKMSVKSDRVKLTEDAKRRIKEEDFKRGGSVASKRADGIAKRGKTRGMMR